jgi:hypothetical protein
MTKRWSSTKSLDGNTKQAAAKEMRRTQKRILHEELEELSSQKASKEEK